MKKYINQEHGNTISEVLDDPTIIEKTIYRTKYDNLDILPSDLTLYLKDAKLRLSDGSRENKLKRATNYVKSKYDFMIFDCSPVKSMVSINVLYTNPLVIIPVSPSDDSMQGLALTINEINTMEEIYTDLNSETTLLTYTYIYYRI